MFCASCGQEIPDIATFCHHCGNPAAKISHPAQVETGRQQPAPRRQIAIRGWILGGLVILTLLLAGLLLFRKPETVEVTRLVKVTRVVEVTPEAFEYVVVEGEIVEVTRLVEVFVEVPGEESVVEVVEVEVEVTRVVVETVVEVVEVEVTRIVEVEVAGEAGPAEVITFAGGGDTLAAVQDRGILNCGVSGALPGFSFVEDDGSISGFDWDYCRVVAAAVLGDAKAVKGRPATATERFPILQSGEIDVLIRNTTWTVSRDTSLGFNFAPTTFYDGQGIMVRKDSGITSLEDLNGGTICVSAGTTTEKNLADVFRSRGIDYEPVVFVEAADVYQAYDEGRCDAWTTDKTGLIANGQLLSDPVAHIILAETLSKEPLGPLVRHGDDNWLDIVKWTVNCTILAEDLGVNSANVDGMLGSDDRQVLNLLGVEGDLGQAMGLNNGFCYQIIKQVGNYEEIYDRNLGSNSPFNLPRGLNSLWTEGGLLYSPPFR